MCCWQVSHAGSKLSCQKMCARTQRATVTVFDCTNYFSAPYTTWTKTTRALPKVSGAKSRSDIRRSKPLIRYWPGLWRTLPDHAEARTEFAFDFWRQLEGFSSTRPNNCNDHPVLEGFWYSRHNGGCNEDRTSRRPPRIVNTWSSSDDTRACQTYRRHPDPKCCVELHW